MGTERGVPLSGKTHEVRNRISSRIILGCLHTSFCDFREKLMQTFVRAPYNFPHGAAGSSAGFQGYRSPQPHNCGNAPSVLGVLLGFKGTNPGPNPNPKDDTKKRQNKEKLGVGLAERSDEHHSPWCTFTAIPCRRGRQRGEVRPVRAGDGGGVPVGVRGPTAAGGSDPPRVPHMPAADGAEVRRSATFGDHRCRSWFLTEDWGHPWK